VFPHRRHNPLTGEWVLVSPHRTARPWLGQVERPPVENRPEHDPGCYLCPGNERAGGTRNPAYTDTYVFDNDFAALVPEAQGQPTPLSEGLLRLEPERGLCRVVCFSPRHDLTLAELPVPAIRRVVDTWIEQFLDLSAKSFVSYVQVFENKGAMMGASNPHPHGQIWASEHLPNEPAKEHAAQAAYQRKHGRCLLCDVLAAEQASGERVVCANASFVALVPFWAVWPFETLLVSLRHAGGLDELDEGERDDLADILKRLTIRYDNLFEVSFPYSMGWHQRPARVGRRTRQAWHLHAHFYPPLLRSATVRKFMVGYEMLAAPQRDLTAEAAAERLRSLPKQHYKERQMPV
jgi:UDPglucose--hexose-1-phosphate uridylyltransferase